MKITSGIFKSPVKNKANEDLPDPYGPISDQALDKLTSFFWDPKKTTFF